MIPAEPVVAMIIREKLAPNAFQKMNRSVAKSIGWFFDGDLPPVFGELPPILVPFAIILSPAFAIIAALLWFFDLPERFFKKAKLFLFGED